MSVVAGEVKVKTNAGGLGLGGGMLGKFAQKIQKHTQHYVLVASDSLIEDLGKEIDVWKKQLENDIKFREHGEQDNIIITRENEKLRIRLEQQRSMLNSKRRDPFKQQKITQTLEMIKKSREELLVIKASLVIQERIHAELTERMQKHLDDLEEKVSLEQKIVQCKESIERLKIQYEKLLKLMAKLKSGTAEQIRITSTLTSLSQIMFMMHQYERRTSTLDSNFLHTGIELYRVLEESRKLISRNNLISDKLPYTLSPLKDEYMLSIMDRWASLDLQVDDAEQVKFSKMSVAYFFRIFIVEVKINQLIGFLEKQCEDFDVHQNMLRQSQTKMLAIEYEDVKENEIEEASKINDTIDGKMQHFNKIIEEYTVVVQVQRTGVDRFQEKIRVQCSAMAKERFRLNDILSNDGSKRVYKCVDTLKDFYYDVERVLKLKWLSHRYDYFINFRRQVMDLTSENNDLAANFHILRMTLDKIKRAMFEIENQDIQRIDKLIRKLDIFMESALKDHEKLVEIEKRVAALQLSYDELRQIVCDEAEKQVRGDLKSRDTQAKTLLKRDNELLEYLNVKKNQYEGLKNEIDMDDIELYNKFQTYEGQIIEVTHDEEMARDQCIQIQQRVDRLTKQFDNLSPVQMKDIDEVSDIIDLLNSIGIHVQITEHLIEEAFKKIKDFEHAIKEILKYIRNRRIANCDKSYHITFASLDRMIKLIDRYNNDMRNIQDDQNKLINNGHPDQEKDRDTTQFSEEINQRLDQLKVYAQKRDELKSQLEHYQKEFEAKKNGDQESSGIEFSKIQQENEKLRMEIQKRIQSLEGQMADDIQSTKDTNVQLLHKYQQKIEKHQQGVNLRGQKLKDFQDWLQRLADMSQRQKKLEKALDTIKFSPEHQPAFNHFNNRLLNNQDKVNEADRLLQSNSKIINVEASDLDMLPTSIVKIAKLEYIYDMLLKMKFLTDTFNDDIGNFNDELKQLEKEIYDYLNRLKASQYQDCVDLFNKLENSLEKLNLKIQDVDGDKQVFDKEFDEVKDKLKNREAIQNAYNGLSGDHSDIKKKRDKFAQHIATLKERFAKIDKENVSVKDCEDIIAEGNQLDHQINDEYDKDVEVQEKIRRLLMKLRNMNANEEERMRLMMLIKTLIGDNRELLRLMKQNIDISDDKSHEFEKLYMAMIASVDYQTRKANNSKKLPKLARMREENVRYTRLRNDAIAYIDKYTDEYLEDTYDIDEFNEIVAHLQKMNGELKGYVQVLTNLVKTLDRRRLKVQDAEVRKNANRHMKTHDEVEELQSKCIKAIASIEGALNASNAKDKAGQQKKEDALAKLQGYQAKFEEFRPKFERVSREIKELYAEIKPLDLENTVLVTMLAIYIERLASIGAMLRELRVFIDGLFKELDELLSSLSSLDLERKLRELIDQLQNAKIENDGIADHIRRIIKLTDSYDGYTSGNEDKSFFTGMNGKSKKLLEELNASSAGMMKSVQDLEKVILVFRSDKKTGDPAKDQVILDKRKGEINVLEQMVNKHMVTQKRILEDSLGNKQKMSDHTLEDKVGRRRAELEEIEKNNDDNLQQILGTKQLVEEEITNIQDDKDMAAHIEKMRAQLVEGDKFIPQLEEFQRRNGELQIECDQLAEQVEQANSQDGRIEMRLNLYDLHLILKKKIREFKKEMQAFWILITQWITIITTIMGKKPEKVVVVKPAFKVTPGDDIDKMLAEMLGRLNCTVPISRLGGGYYMFGSKKIFCKIINGKLVVRVGGGYMGIEEFILTYMKGETDKAGAAAKIEEQIKAKGNSNFSAAAVTNQNKKVVKK